MNEPTAEQIHQAFAAQLATVAGGKLELADAVRDCCRDLPLGEALTVAGHTLRRIEAYCIVWGGFDWQREDNHTKQVLVLNGRLLDEPPFVITRPDYADSFHRGGDWEGPKGGWYSVAAEQRYCRLCEQYPGGDVDIKKPVALPLCGAKELSEAAEALPAAMATWHSQQHKAMDSLAATLGARAESLHLQTVTTHHDRLIDMGENEAKNAAATETASVQKLFVVVCADMAFYSEREQSLGCHELVYISAPDADAACEQAKRALRVSGIPLVGFDQADLQKIITEMADCELQPGEARNWTRGMTDLQMEASYAGVTDEDEQGV